jgi:hypothetical protein
VGINDMPDQSTEQREHGRGQQSAQQSVYGSNNQGAKGQQPGQQHQQGQQGRPGNGGQDTSGMQNRPDDLKRGARNAEAEERAKAAREMAEQFADRSREQIDRYERAFGEFWRVAESDGFMPFARGVARANMELAGLASRRAKAYAEFPVQLTRCQTPNDMLNRQMRFFSELVSDYQETIGRVTRTWAEASSPQNMMRDGGQMMGQWGEGAQAAGQMAEHTGERMQHQPPSQQQSQQRGEGR